MVGCVGLVPSSNFHIFVRSVVGAIQRWPVMAGVVHSRSGRVVAPCEVYVEVAVDCRHILRQYTGYFSMIAIYITSTTL